MAFPPIPPIIGTPPLGADAGTGEGGPPPPPYGSGWKKCWRIEKICAVDIKRGSCCNGFCNFEIKIRKTVSVTSDDNCDDCPHVEGNPEFSVSKEECPRNFFHWQIAGGVAGTKLKFRCRTVSQECTDTPPQHGSYTHTIDFNCGPGARDSQPRGKRGKQLTLAIEKCLGEGTEAEKCEKICSLADMSDNPDDGGIGNKEYCDIIAHVGPFEQCCQFDDAALIARREKCEDELSAKFMDALDKWLKDNC